MIRIHYVGPIPIGPTAVNNGDQFVLSIHGVEVHRVSFTEARTVTHYACFEIGDAICYAVGDHKLAADLRYLAERS